MSRSRRNFSAEFKTNLVLQLLKGEKELNVFAVENDIQPNLLRNWKKEFLTNASLAFDNKREYNLREKLAKTFCSCYLRPQKYVEAGRRRGKIARKWYNSKNISLIK